MIKQQINAFETQEMVWVLKQMQQKSFEGSNKPRKYLSCILKKKRQNGIINKITVDGKEIVDKLWIKLGFKRFF